MLTLQKSYEEVEEGIFCIYIFYPSSQKNNLICPIRPHPPMSVIPALMRFLQASTIPVHQSH
jgi:hypothetical protein